VAIQANPRSNAELSERLSESEAKLSRIEQSFANIAVRVKEKQDQKQRPRTWQEAKERLEAESNG
jgi:23S rRNA G2069 N7-methylase RlmK/C1962 C5-methylase RlmI